MTLTTMTRKERMRRALYYEPIDRIPTQINYTAAFKQTMATHFNVPPEQLPYYLGNHMVRVDISYDRQLSDDGKVRFDWWGVGFDAREEGYFAAISPLAEAQDLDLYHWPDPYSPDLLHGAEETCISKGEEYFIVPNLGFALFERAWSLRGFEQFFMDMATDPAYAGMLLDRITEIQLVLIHRYLDLGVHGGYFGDDYGAQKNLLFSPRMWRVLIKPRLARLFSPFLERDLPIIMHSDGQIQQILPDLLEIGLTTLNPVQPEVLDHVWLRDQYGGRLSFYGGISTQTVLPYGTADQVKTAVCHIIRTLAPEGTGLVIAPSHRMMSDIPLQNVAVMLEAFRQSN
ncbi:MAG: uroporphyrinogen decarboxylase family protein [Candidatus Promineifilaceae bacterium]